MGTVAGRADPSQAGETITGGEGGGVQPAQGIAPNERSFATDLLPRVAEVAEILAVGAWAVDHYCENGELPHVRMNNSERPTRERPSPDVIRRWTTRCLRVTPLLSWTYSPQSLAVPAKTDISPSVAPDRCRRAAEKSLSPYRERGVATPLASEPPSRSWRPSSCRAHQPRRSDDTCAKLGDDGTQARDRRLAESPSCNSNSS